MSNIDQHVAAAFKLTESAAPLFAGQHPAAVGSALADLLATWLAGHPESARERLLASHVEHVRLLVPVQALAQRRAGQSGG